MTKTLLGLDFDPGFAEHLLAFRGTVEYLYLDINRFKNFSQKKLKFMQYHKKILDVLNNNLGFYVGCLMWAAYLKTQPEQEIVSNHCYGQDYNEEENISEIVYMQRFIELFPKDMKYFISKEFSFDENTDKLLKVYKEFLILNKGFVETKTNSDIKIPESVDLKNAETYKEKIETVLKTKDLSKLLEYLPLVI